MPSVSNVTLFYNPIVLEHHDAEMKHLESPVRIMTTTMHLKRIGLFNRPKIKTGHEATLTELAMVHEPEYIRRVINATPQSVASDSTHFSKDMFCSRMTPAAARTSVGMSLDAATDVLYGNTTHAMVLCRPPGHHASYKSASGFCFFNNIVYAAKLLSPHRKVLIFDWDVHHGDGTELLVSGMKNVSLVTIQRSKYEDGEIFWPGTGGTHSNGNIHSVGFTSDITGPQYMQLFNTHVKPLIEAEEPDVILVSAGFDTAKGDPLGGCNLGPEHYRAMMDYMVKHGSVIAFLEGGYGPKAVATGVAEVLVSMLKDAK